MFLARIFGDLVLLVLRESWNFKYLNLFYPLVIVSNANVRFRTIFWICEI